MKLRITSPVKAFISDCSALDRHELVKLLSYANTAAAYLVKRHIKNVFWRSRNAESWEARYEELKAAVNTTLIFNEDGQEFIRPGSIPHIAEHFDLEVINEIKYPTPKKMPWAKPLPFDLYPYQKNCVTKLIAEKHGNVSLCTGSGKSAAIMTLCRETGFKAAVIVPSKSIFLELFEKFETHFGKGQIGTFGNGKKKLGKRLTICIGDSLANIKKDSPEFEFFSSLEMVVVDESHTFAAETLEDVCHGVLANVPYRYFFSGTQTRGDGGEKLLFSIIGRTVETLSTAAAVAGGYICPHEYRIVSVPSSNPNLQSGEALEMKRVHFLNNRNIIAFAAKLANSDWLVNRRQTLILVDELSQVSALAKLLKVPFALAHSESNKVRLAELEIGKVKPEESVEKFNKGEARVLVGTSCIGTGTNIYMTHNTLNLQGGSSEIKTKQGAVGRSVRFMEANPYKNDCAPKTVATIWDFDVTGIAIMERHLKERLKYYAESGSPIKYLKL